MIEISLSHAFADGSFRLEAELSLPGSGVTGIFGRSGSGKTTLLRCIAGLEQAAGSVLVNGETWQQRALFLPTHQRDVGYVFQESSLFDHLTAGQNIAYAIRRAAVPPDDSETEHILALMALQPLLDQYPRQLSGGERQRVAIARALLIRPRLLLMDEPLASLDVARRGEILPYLERATTELDMPVLYVSHAIEEISRLADHLVVLDEGSVVANGSLAEVLSTLDLPLPAGEETGVVLQCRIRDREEKWHLLKVGFSGGELWVRDAGRPSDDAVGRDLRVRVLARDVSLARTPHDDTSIQNRVPVTIVEMTGDPDDAMTLIRLQAGDDFMIARLTRRAAADMALSPGDSLWAQIKTAAIVR